MLIGLFRMSMSYQDRMERKDTSSFRMPLKCSVLKRRGEGVNFK